MVEATLYDYLVTTKISEATVEQLDSSSRSTFVNDSNINFWRGPITVSKVIDASRTYPHGIGIPESGTITSSVMGAGETAEFQPPGTEVWEVIGLSVVAAAGTPTILVNLHDGGSGFVEMHSGDSSTSSASFFPFEAPFTIRNSLYLYLINTDGANAASVSIAYSKVSL